MNPDFEINQLRWQLQSKDYTHEEIDELCDIVSHQVNEVILDIVENAVAEAIMYAESNNIHDFISDINIIDTGESFRIWTLSGITDYSTPEVQMLPHLLKNADIAADGSRYKVIPVKEKTKPSTTMGTSSVDVLKRQQVAADQARLSLKQNRGDNLSAKAHSMANDFRAALARNMDQQRKEKQQSIASGTPKFRTASSKQDPKTMWVLPEKELDMTQFLLDLNDRMRDEIHRSVTIIVNSYKEDFA